MSIRYGLKADGKSLNAESSFQGVEPPSEALNRRRREPRGCRHHPGQRASQEDRAAREPDTYQWYEAARRKENTMVAVHLQSAASPPAAVWCGTYHMPCVPTEPKLMAMHALPSSVLAWSATTFCLRC